ncbi:unnamed protein product [Linum trigynum]|uniref:Uncharacterized protein n=1 Tax=Linum trigynum TaxID=586398 RepID=A0AAV2D977_9ROSI
MSSRVAAPQPSRRAWPAAEVVLRQSPWASLPPARSVAPRGSNDVRCGRLVPAVPPMTGPRALKSSSSNQVQNLSPVETCGKLNSRNRALIPNVRNKFLMGL